MEQEINSSEFNKKTASNIILKSKILLTLFSVIFLIQFVAIFYFKFTNSLQQYFSNNDILLAPLILVTLALLEFYFIKLGKKWLESGKTIFTNTFYALLILEVSFPAFALYYLCSFFKNSTVITPYDILNSPLLYSSLFLLFYLLFI